MWFIVLIGCGVSGSPEFGSGGSASDSGHGAGSPSGSGGDDSGSGNGGGDGDETGAAICDADDLLFHVEIADAAGTTGLVFSAPADITSRAIFSNPCDGLLRFTTPDGCLVNGWELTDGTGNTRSSADNCVESETTWTFEALEGTSVAVEWGTLQRSTYEITADSDPLGRRVSEFFSVQ